MTNKHCTCTIKAARQCLAHILPDIMSWLVSSLEVDMLNTWIYLSEELGYS
jgi:hypothetical protein